MSTDSLALVATTATGPGILHQLTGVIARHQGDISSVEILDGGQDASRIYLEISLPLPLPLPPLPVPLPGETQAQTQSPTPHAKGGALALLAELRAMPIVRHIEEVQTFQRIYGKRIIIIGGGAQVGQVAIGAISEADRHNIRGELISVDTIPLVGERTLAEAVRAVARLPRARALVLAGSLMGGDIETAVREVRARGLLVVSLNMAGSVPDAADLVVTDPIQAGVMTVMAIADTAKFSIDRLKKRVF
jgi:energy-converting hydrogenase B subunit Q